jgi:hypothetical protein
VRRGGAAPAVVEFESAMSKALRLRRAALGNSPPTGTQTIHDDDSFEW